MLGPLELRFLDTRTYGQLIHQQRRRASIRRDPSRHLSSPGIQPSVGSIEESYDNALAENFVAPVKNGLVYRCSWRTRDWG